MLILLITVSAALAGFFAGAGVCMAVSRKSGGRAGRKAAREISPRDEELLIAVESYGRR